MNKRLAISLAAFVGWLLIIVALGYRASEDFNAKLPKSRLPLEQVLTRL